VAPQLFANLAERHAGSELAPQKERVQLPSVTAVHSAMMINGAPIVAIVVDSANLIGFGSCTMRKS
jgi:hypothetical protein